MKWERCLAYSKLITCHQGRSVITSPLQMRRKEIPPMFQSSDITGNARHSLPAHNTSSSWPKVHWMRRKGERNLSFKNPVFISHNGLKPHMKYGAGFPFQDSRNLLSLHISLGLPSPWAIAPCWGREITFRKRRMNWDLSSALRHAFWMAPSAPNITEETKCLPSLQLFLYTLQSALQIIT